MKPNMRMAGTALLVCLVVTGCANNREMLVKSFPTTQRTVLTENIVSEGQQGNAVLDFDFAVKSNSWRFFEIYNKHSNPPYRVHLNINGQPTILEAEPVLEDNSYTRTPESGTGWKYKFSKRITLAPGRHKVTITLPIDDVIVESEVDLRAGVNTLTAVPVYNRRMLRPYKGQNFTAGVNTLKIIVQ